MALTLPSLAAAAAKLLQLCLTLCDPIDGSPPDSPIPGILQARTQEWAYISISMEPLPTPYLTWPMTIGKVLHIYNIQRTKSCPSSEHSFNSLFSMKMSILT